MLLQSRPTASLRPGYDRVDGVDLSAPSAAVRRSCCASRRGNRRLRRSDRLVSGERGRGAGFRRAECLKSRRDHAGFAVSDSRTPATSHHTSCSFPLSIVCFPPQELCLLTRETRGNAGSVCPKHILWALAWVSCFVPTETEVATDLHTFSWGGGVGISRNNVMWHLHEAVAAVARVKAISSQPSSSALQLAMNERNFYASMSSHRLSPPPSLALRPVADFPASPKDPNGLDHDHSCSSNKRSRRESSSRWCDGCNRGGHGNHERRGRRCRRRGDLRGDE